MIRLSGKNEKKYYITTPIYYPNALPHIGTSFTTFVADFMARFKRSQGHEVFFLTGNDEHGMKLVRAAEENGMGAKEFVDKQAEAFRQVWAKFGITYDRFIRTTDPDHEETVKQIFQKIYDKGDIYKGYYEGFYCVGCEQYYTEKELEEGNVCPIHKKPLEILRMESYFFKLSEYQDKLLKFYEDNKDFLPERYATELTNRVKEGLKDVSVSRPKEYLSWGVEIPFDKNHVTYVWFDALLNYVTGAGYQEGPDKFSERWPADVHFIGKDIQWFHGVIWPAMLMSAGIEPPKRLGIHGFLTVNGQKISKSLGNAVDPVAICDEYGTHDVLRYYLLREVPFGPDGDFSHAALKERYNKELVNEYGNLVNRVFVMFSKYCSGEGQSGKEGGQNKGELDLKLAEGLDKAIKEYADHVDKLEFKQAVDNIWLLVSRANAYINEKEPWKMGKENPEEAAKVVRSLVEYLGILNSVLAPLLPQSSERLADHLGLKGGKPIPISELKPFGQNVDLARAKKEGLILYARKE